MSISPVAKAAQDQARQSNGQFGTQAHGEQEPLATLNRPRITSPEEGDKIADNELRVGLASMADAVNRVSHRVQANDMVDMVREEWPDATALIMEVVDEDWNLYITGYLKADGNYVKAPLRGPDDSAIDDIEYELNHLQRSGALDEFPGERTPWELQLPPAGSGAFGSEFRSPAFAVRQAQQDAEQAMIAAEGKALAARLWGRHPDAASVTVYTRDSDYDAVDVDGLTMTDGRFVAMHHLDADTQGVLFRAFHEAGAGRQWGMWAPGGVNDELEPTVLDLDHMWNGSRA